jgi:TolA-binding protein
MLTGRQKAHAALDIAESYRQQRKYAEALQLYQEVIDSKPDSVQAVRAYKGLGLSAAQLGQDGIVDSAIAALKNNSKEAEAPAAAVQIAEVYYGKSKQAKAVEIFNTVLDTWPDTEQAALLCARTIEYYLNQKDKASADAGLQKLLSVSTTSMRYSDYLHQTAQRYFNAGYKEDGLALYRRNVSLFKDIHTRNSQRELAFYSIDTGDDAGVDAAVDNLVKNYSAGFDVSSDIFDLGQRYTRNKKTTQAAKLYQFDIDTFPGTNGALRSQRELAFIELDAGRTESADAMVDKLINDYVKQANLPQEIQNIAARYTQIKQPQKAQKLYQYVLDTWPKTNNALSAQREIAYLMLDANDVTSARQEIDSLVNSFASSNTLPNELYNIGLKLSQKGNTDDAMKLHKYNSATFPDNVGAMRSQAQIVQLNIKDGNQPGADAAYAVLTEVFAKQAVLPDEIYKTADVYIETGKYDKAGELEQTVITKWPKTDSAMNAQLGIVKIHFAKDDLDNANTALDTVITDYNDNPQLSLTMFNFGEQYWNKAVSDSRQKNATPKSGKIITDKTKEYFANAQFVWNRVSKDLPESQWAPYACRYTAESYRILKQYDKAIEYYQKVVDNWPNYEFAWLAQFQIVQLYMNLFKQKAMSLEDSEAATATALIRLLELYPDCPVAANAQKMLANVQRNIVR